MQNKIDLQEKKMLALNQNVNDVFEQKNDMNKLQQNEMEKFNESFNSLDIKLRHVVNNDKKSKKNLIKQINEVNNNNNVPNMEIIQMIIMNMMKIEEHLERIHIIIILNVNY